MKNSIIPNWVSYGILFITAFLFVFLFSCTTSPLYEHHPFWFHGDSGIFQEMGVCLAQGGTPYLDLFDHKGPILWFIQALGILISPRWGIVILQTLFLSVTLILWYKSVHILTQRQIASLLISFLGLFFLMAFCQRGNLCEEWSLPFISLPIFLYVNRWRTNSSYKHLDSFVIGLCVGVLAMIRLNNTAPIIGFVLWHFICCIKAKDYRRLRTDIALMCGGIALIIIICAIFYLLKAGWNGVYEMIYGTFIFNFLYFEDKNALPFISVIQHYILPVVFILTSITLLFKNKNAASINTSCIISYIITIFAIGSFEFWHYMMVFIPLFVLTSGLAIQREKIWGYILLGLVIVFSGFIGYDATDVLLFRLRGKKANTETNDGFHRFVSSLPLIERESIYNAGLNHIGAGLFADENIYQCNRIIYKGHTDISKRLQDYEATHGIKDLQPIWVLTQSSRPKASDDYMAQNYTLADSIPGGEFNPIWCWKKKYEHESLESNE